MKNELENELDHTKEKVAHLGKIALGIGGGLLLTFLIVGKFSNKKNQPSKTGDYPKSKRVYHRFRDQLVHELTSQATIFLLGIAKDKLSSMGDNKESKENVDS